MQIDWSKFEEGFRAFEKEATYGGNTARRLNNQLPFGMSNFIDDLKPQTVAPPPMPSLPATSGFVPSQVSSAVTPSDFIRPLAAPKMAGLIDPKLVKNLFTAEALRTGAKTITEGSQENNNPKHPQVILESQYPEMKKLLADEQTREYLESLLTEDSNNAHKTNLHTIP